MSSFTPALPQEVLWSIRVQAEQAQCLVEDIQAGSETASIELMNLSGKIAARSRSYKWIRLTMWATALEDRLARVTRSERATGDDIEWLERHVGHLDQILEDPNGAVESTLETGESKIGSLELDLGTDFNDADRADAGEDEVSVIEGGEPDPGVEAERAQEARPALETPPARPEHAQEARPVSETTPAVKEAPAPPSRSKRVRVQAKSAPRSASGPSSAVIPPVVLRKDTGEAVLTGGHAMSESTPSVHSPQSAALAAAPVPGPISRASEGEGETAPRRDTDDGERETAVAGHTEPALETDERKAPESGEALAEPLSTPEAGTESASIAPGAEVELIEEPDLESQERAVLAKLDIKRIQHPVATHTEIQGPQQYVLLGVSDDPEVHLWLGRTLPERRFEFFIAKNPTEAETLCREHQPDLVLISWESGSAFAQHTLDRVRENPLTRYVRAVLVTHEANLASQLAANRLGALGVIPRSAKPRDVFARVLFHVLSQTDRPEDDIGETSMSELSALVLDELRMELDAIRGLVGDVVEPIGHKLGSTMRETSRQLREGVRLALGVKTLQNGSDGSSDQVQGVLKGKRVLVLEADRLRRAELARVLAELETEVLPPQADLTKALEAGLTWAPDILVGGAPAEDTLSCVRILRRDVALSSMCTVLVEWPATNREWPDPKADMAVLRPWLEREMVHAFAPITELQRRLRREGDVSGRVESCGVLALLRVVMHTRPSALLRVTEGTERIDVSITDGKVLDARWTEADGTETEHRDAFFRLLTVARGRFKVCRLDAAPEPALPPSLGESLAAACMWWRPLGLTIDRRLPLIQSLALDARRTTELKRHSGKAFRTVVNALIKGDTPQSVIDGGIEPSTVAHVLRELVRRFVVSELPVKSAPPKVEQEAPTE